MNRFGLGPSDVGRLVGYNHASAINSSSIVRDMLLTKNPDYIDEIVKWAEVFDEVLPNGELSSLIIQQRLDYLLESLTSDRLEKIYALGQLIKKYQENATTLEQVV